MQQSHLYTIQTYQTDKFVVHYLATAARRIDQAASLFVPQPTKNQGRNSGHRKTTEERIYSFSVETWKDFAIAIRDYGGAVSKDFLIILRSTIRTRKECAQWCMSLGLGTVEEDESHQHPIRTLEEIFEFLKPKCPAWSRPTITPAPAPSTPNNHTNYFDHLEEDEEVLTPEIATWTQRRTRKGEVKEAFLPEFTKRNLILAVYLHLKASGSIVTHARQQCIRFQKRDITLSTFAEIMNASIYLLHQLNEDFAEQVTKLKKVVKYPNEFLHHGDILAFCITSKAKSAAKSHGIMDLHERTYKILEHCFTNPLLTRTKEDFGASLTFLEDADLALANHEKTFVYVLTCILAMSSAYEGPTKNGGLAFDAKAENGTHLLNLLPMVAIHLRLYKTLPTWIVYSLQMVAECQELLEEHELHRAFFEMHHTHKWIGVELDHMLEQSPNVIDREAVDNFKKDLEEGCKELDYGSLLGEEANQLAIASLPDPKHRHLYRLVPLMSGTKIQT